MRGRVIIKRMGMYLGTTSDDCVDLSWCEDSVELNNWLHRQAKEPDFVGAEIVQLQDFDMKGWRAASGLSIAQSEIAACDFLENRKHPQAAEFLADGRHISDFFTEEGEGDWTLEYRTDW